MSTHSMNINFILPGFYAETIIGGFRVHYEYANRLSELGHRVTISHMMHVPSSINNTLIRKIMTDDIFQHISWFKFNTQIKLTVLPNNRFIEPCDVLILTAWQTSEVFGDRHDIAWLTLQIAYDYEFWMSANEDLKQRMVSAFNKPDIMISTSNAVSKMLTACDRKINATINCGFDSKIYNLKMSIDSRKMIIGIIMRDDPIKRSSDALAALEIIQKKFSVTVIAGGNTSAVTPNWITKFDTTTDHDMSRFYNSLRIFLLPSEFEGWGLPAIEAMACGAAVVSTKNGGVEDFLVNEKNSLLCTPRKIDEMVAAIERLISDDHLRVSLAKNGLKTVEEYSWDRSVKLLESICASNLN